MICSVIDQGKQVFSTKRNSKYRGILLILGAAFCFSCMNVCVRLAGDVPTFQKSFFRNLVAVLAALVVLLRDGKGIRPADPKNWPLLLCRSLFGTIGLLGNFYAVDHLLLADASMLNKMSPFFAVIASFFLLKEKLSPVQGVSLAGAFAGALLIIKPTLSNMDLGPSLVGLGAGIAYTLVRLLGKRGERGAFIVFVFSAFSCLAVLPYVLVVHAPMTVKQVLTLVAAGLFAAGGQFSVTAAYCCAPAKEISVYDYSQIIFSTLLGFFIFGDVPDRLSVLGYFLICGMAVLNFWHSSRSSRKPS